MKTKLFGIMAIIIAIGASAFTSPKHVKNSKRDGLEWFAIANNHLPGAAVPSADATFLNEGDAPIGGPDCEGSTDQCVSGFNSTQVDQSTNKLIGNTQTAANTDMRKN